MKEDQIIGLLLKHSKDFALPAEYARYKKVDRQLVNYWIKTKVLVYYEIPDWGIKLIPKSEENDKRIEGFRSKKLKSLLKSMTADEVNESVRLLEEIRKKGKDKKL